jgi:hypothetical protein
MPEGRLCDNTDRRKAKEIVSEMWNNSGYAVKVVRIMLRNNTTETMRYIDDNVRGKWNYWPPKTIPADMQAGFSAESSNSMVGTDGWVKWAIGDTGEILARYW